MEPDAAFLELYRLYAPRLYTYCVRVTGSPDDAADALQETFTSVYARLRSDQTPIEHPRAYLFAIARNASLRRVDDRRRVAVVGDVPEAEPGSALSEAEVEVLTRDLQEEVRAANARLPERQREVLVLHEVEQLPYAEIGELMGLHPNAVAQLAWRARLGLRGALRRGALYSLPPVGADCDRALGLIALREDGELDAADSAWLNEHLATCERCPENRRAMIEAGTTYRSWTPVEAAPIAAALLLEEARAAVGMPHAGDGPHGPRRSGAGRMPSPWLLGGALLLGVVTALALFPPALRSPDELPAREAAALAAAPTTTASSASPPPPAQRRPRNAAATTPDAGPVPAATPSVVAQAPVLAPLARRGGSRAARPEARDPAPVDDEAEAPPSVDDPQADAPAPPAGLPITLPLLPPIPPPLTIEPIAIAPVAPLTIPELPPAPPVPDLPPTPTVSEEVPTTPTTPPDPQCRVEC